MGPLKQPETDEEPGFSGKFDKNQFEDQLKPHGRFNFEAKGSLPNKKGVKKDIVS